MIGTLLAWTMAAGLFALGFATLPWPAWMSRVYGAPVDSPGGLVFVRATGLRDIVLGAMLLAFLVFGDARGAAVVTGGTGLCAVVDLVFVVTHRSVRDVLPQLAIHVSGIFGGAWIAGLLVIGW